MSYLIDWIKEQFNKFHSQNTIHQEELYIEKFKNKYIKCPTYTTTTTRWFVFIVPSEYSN